MATFNRSYSLHIYSIIISKKKHNTFLKIKHFEENTDTKFNSYNKVSIY